jgi:hypothetical protein
MYHIQDVSYNYNSISLYTFASDYFVQEILSNNESILITHVMSLLEAGGKLHQI